MPHEIRKVIAYELLRRVPEIDDCNELADDVIRTLAANGYTIAPLPENLTDKQIGAALDTDMKMTERVQRREITLGEAWVETYRAALESITLPKESTDDG